MRIRLLAILALLVLVPAGYASAAVGSNICTGATECTAAEVGTFMQGISVACGNLGTCSITDITQVFYNVGNFILGTVGALVFLAYVVGGFYFLVSGAPGIDQAKYRQKGMDALKKSTLGLIIVFVAFAGLRTIKTILIGGSLDSANGYYLCGPGDINAGLPCDLNSTCSDTGSCVSACEQRNVNSAISVADDSVLENVYRCVDITTADNNNYGLGPDWYAQGSPEKDLCPGDANNQCMNFSFIFK